jgi:hypothetical protein
MKDYVVNYKLSTVETHLAEELFACIGTLYYYTGKGFNIGTCGSYSFTTLLREIPYHRVHDAWKKCYQFRYEDMMYEA